MLLTARTGSRKSDEEAETVLVRNTNRPSETRFNPAAPPSPPASPQTNRRLKVPPLIDAQLSQWFTINVCDAELTGPTPPGGALPLLTLYLQEEQTLISSYAEPTWAHFTHVYRSVWTLKMTERLVVHHRCERINHCRIFQCEDMNTHPFIIRLKVLFNAPNI